MSEWLAKPRISEEDIRKAQPSLVKFFPMLTRYFVEDQKMRVTVVFEHDQADRFRAAVTKAYGFFGPSTIHKAADEALAAWVKQHS